MPADFLCTQLHEVATIARRQTAKIAATVYHTFGDSVDRAEFKAYSESAAFLAFVDLGGDPEDPEQFDWHGQRKLLLSRTQRELRKLLKGADQGFDDDRLRRKNRAERACVQEFRWQVWGDVAVVRDETTPVTQGGTRRSASANCKSRYSFVATTVECDAPMISAELDDQLAALGKVLPNLLSDDALALLTEVYFKGRTQHELAREMAAVDARYAGKADGETRAYSAVMAKTCRARQRLKAALGDRWLQLKRDLDDCA